MTIWNDRYNASGKALFAHDTGGLRVLQTLYTAELLMARLNDLNLRYPAEGSRHVERSVPISPFAQKPH